MTGPQQARLLGLLFWLFTGLNVLVVIGIAVLYLAIFGFVFTQVPHRPGDPNPAFIMGALIVAFIFAVVFTVLFSVPKIVAGYGLRRGAPWARIWTIIASAMAMMSFPLGTGIGIFGLIFVFGDEGKQFFANLEQGGSARSCRREVRQ